MPIPAGDDTLRWAPDYVTVADLKAFVRVGDTDDDVQVALAVTAASRAVDQHCGRQFGQVADAEERTYTAWWDRRRCRWMVDIDDLMTTAGLTVTSDAGSVDAYVVEPVNAVAVGRPWTRLVVDPDSTVLPTGDVNGVTATGVWGWSAVPTAVKQATLLQASRFLARRDSPYGVAGSPDTGGELRLLARVDPDVAVVLNPFRRKWAAA